MLIFKGRTGDFIARTDTVTDIEYKGRIELLNRTN
jgi:hypothetical protein